jgi:hypothetical protein
MVKSPRCGQGPFAWVSAGPFDAVAHWLLADRDMAIVRDAIVAAGVAVVSIGIWDLIFWVSSLQFPVE